MAQRPTKIDRAKIDSDTVWKLLDARCKQLSEVIAATRIPFLLALSWALVWFWALYTTDQGYMKLYRIRYVAITAMMNSTDQDNINRFKDLCTNTIARRDSLPTVGGKAVTPDKDWDLDYCKKLVGRRAEFSEKSYLDQRLISFPGGFAKVHISDLGILGNLAFILILSWTFFAIRRENLAVETFVKSDAEKKNAGWIPRTFNLIPQGEIFTAVHLAYAYQVISQRFLFILTTNSRALLLSTLILCSFPAVVSFLHLFTDVRDILITTFEAAAVVRVLIEGGLFAIVCALTARIASFIVDTCVLVNGWNLAVRDVWLKDWNESQDETAPTVNVNVSEQRAERAKT